MAHDLVRGILRSALFIAAASAPSIAQAEPVPPPAYRIAARQAGVPAPVLYAVALQESGAQLRRRLIPWPWTLDVAGRAERFATRAEACAGLHQAIGQTSLRQIDVGLGQINLGYHARRYAAPCDLLDPYRNLAITARILREQHAMGEDWLLAVGRYHRPAGGEAAARYRHSVSVFLAPYLVPSLAEASSGEAAQPLRPTPP